MTSKVESGQSELGDFLDLAAIRGRVIAIVSGKGGSGKTMLAAEIAQIISTGEINMAVTLMDVDLGTGGLSYYFGIKQVRNIKHGLIDLLVKEKLPNRSSVLGKLQRLAQNPDKVRLLPIGDFGRLGPRIRDRYSSIEAPSAPLATVLEATIEHLRSPDSVVVVDCRGGIDEEMITLCTLVDHIILVSEADTTSFQASRHLMEELSKDSVLLSHKVVGFVLNKVFEDPAPVIRNGTAVFGVQSLGSIPFDFEATRAFLVGNVPNPNSTFGVHVHDALSRAYPVDVMPPVRGVWTPSDYSSLSLASPTSSRGGVLLGLMILLLGGSLILALNLGAPTPSVVQAGIGAVTLIGFLSSIEPARRLVGRSIEECVRPLREISRRKLIVALNLTAVTAVGAAITSLLLSTPLIQSANTPTPVFPMPIVPSTTIQTTTMSTPTVMDELPNFPPLVEEERWVELSTQTGNESVEIDTWLQVEDGLGDLQIDQNGIYTTLGAKLSVIEDSLELTYASCSSIKDWVTRVDFVDLREGSQICAQSGREKYAMLQIRTLPQSPGNGGPFVFYGRTWQLIK